MSQLSRRDFVKGSGALAMLPPLPRREPDLVLHHGNFVTMDAQHPRAQAVAIADARFQAVGSNDEVLPLASARTRTINLEGKTVLPGFIDAHSHPASSGRRHLRGVDCDL